MSWVMSSRLPPLSASARGTPVASQITWCLEPGRLRSTGSGPPPERPDVGAADHRPRHVQPAGGPQPGRQHLVQALPDPGVVPVPKPAPAGHARAEARPGRRPLPPDARAEDGQDAAQHLAVIQRLAARVPPPRRQRLDPRPPLVADQPRSGITPPHTRPTGSPSRKTRPDRIPPGAPRNGVSGGGSRPSRARQGSRPGRPRPIPPVPHRAGPLDRGERYPALQSVPHQPDRPALQPHAPVPPPHRDGRHRSSRCLIHDLPRSRVRTVLHGAGGGAPERAGPERNKPGTARAQDLFACPSSSVPALRHGRKTKNEPRATVP
ncbi:hypothetical protein SUDANB58_00065 [Streptomyces sp. enrichment culture]